MFDLSSEAAKLSPATVAGVQVSTASYFNITADPKQSDVVYGVRAGSSKWADGVATAKQYANGTSVDLWGSFVSGSFNGFFYLEDTNRASGIKIVSSTAVSRDDRVRVVGKIETVNGEKQITAEFVEILSSYNPAITPVAISGKAFAPAVGLTTVGLLVTISGNVESVGSGFCTINDGSGPIKVIVPAGVSIPKPGFVACTGVVGIASDGVPVLYMRDVNDLVVVAP